MAKPIKGCIAGIEIGDDYPVRVIGVINLTKNSFYSGSVRTTHEEIVKEVRKMQEEGADIIDVGARSTAPYRKYDIPTEVERRVISEAVKRIVAITDLPVSIDTTRYEVAKAGLEQGAELLNNVYGFRQKNAERLAKLVSAKRLSLILTAHEARRRNLSDPIKRVMTSLEEGLGFAVKNGIEETRIAIDPGIGFFRDPKISNPDWNSSIIANLKNLRDLERPICIGVSRKSFIGYLIGNKAPEFRLNGSIAATAIAIYNGAHLIRTHDVSATLDAVRVAASIQEKGLSHDAE